MNENNFSDFFRQIERTVQDFSSLDTKELKQSINQTVREVKKTVKTAAKQYSDRTRSPFPSPPPSHVGRTSRPIPQPPPRVNHPVYRPPNRTVVPPVVIPTTVQTQTVKKQPIEIQPSISTELAIQPSKVPGRVSGILMIVAGVAAALLFGVSTIATLLFSLISGGNAWPIIFPMLLFVGSLYLVFRGIKLNSRAERYAKYYRELSGVSFCSIKALATQVQKSASFVAKDLQKMIDDSFFHEAHIDAKKTTFMLDDATYEHYLQLEARAAEQKKTQEKREANPELDAAVREGMVCIQKIKEANDAIPGEVISAKLTRLESVVTKIFEFMERHPERLSEIRRFTSYYLPTTLKLVAAYREFETHGIQGETVQTSKKEIEDALDSINASFETMFDNLFEDDARDLSADISVLHAMLKQEGLESDGLTNGSTETSNK